MYTDGPRADCCRRHRLILAFIACRRHVTCVCTYAYIDALIACRCRHRLIVGGDACRRCCWVAMLVAIVVQCFGDFISLEAGGPSSAAAAAELGGAGEAQLIMLATTTRATYRVVPSRNMSYRAVLCCARAVPCRAMSCHGEPSS